MNAKIASGGRNSRMMVEGWRVTSHLRLEIMLIKCSTSVRTPLSPSFHSMTKTLYPTRVLHCQEPCFHLDGYVPASENCLHWDEVIHSYARIYTSLPLIEKILHIYQCIQIYHNVFGHCYQMISRGTSNWS